MSDKTDTFGKIILYYASWCHYSNQFLPEWTKFKEYAKDNLKRLEVIDMDCHAIDDNVLTKNKIIAYPTIILYANDQKITFNDQRKVDKLIDFILQNGYVEYLENVKKELEEEFKNTKDLNEKQINANELEINITI